MLISGCRPEANSPVSSSSALDAEVVTLAATNETDVLPGMQASPLESTNVIRAFDARGLIRAVPSGGKSLLVKHEDIPGFMPKMTMEFEVRDTNELRGLVVGDPIVFRIKADQNESWIEGIRRTGTNASRATN